MRAFRAGVILAACAMLAACGQPKAPAAATEPKAKTQVAVPAAIRAAQAADEAASAREAGVRDAAPDCPADRFRFVADERLSMFELAALAEGPSPEAGPKARRLAFVPFDYDLHPPRGEWQGAGVIYVAGDPPDRRTVGGVLWARGGFLSEGGGAIADTPNGQVLTVTLEPEWADPEGRKINCVGRFRATLFPDGTLSAAGKKVGVFH